MLAQQAGASPSLGQAVLVLCLYGAVIGLFALAWMRILRKAGYSQWLGLVVLIPVVNVIAFLCFAFSDWPVNAEAALRSGAPLPHTHHMSSRQAAYSRNSHHLS